MQNDVSCMSHGGPPLVSRKVGFFAKFLHSVLPTYSKSSNWPKPP